MEEGSENINKSSWKVRYEWFCVDSGFVSAA